MATTMKKTTKKIVEDLTIDTSVEVSEEAVNNIDSKNKNVTVNNKRKYENEEGIPCKSITSGLLLVDGEKSGRLYRWGDYGDVEYIEYRDLVYMITTRRNWVYKPRFIIQDREFVEQNVMLKELYDKLYKTNDLKDILGLPIPEMVAEIQSLPSGAYDAIQDVAASMIAYGSLDSVKKIKALDEIFGSSLLLQLVQE